jgi:hypothetical protein
VLKPVEESGEKTRKIGPQQLCRKTFKVEQDSVVKIKTELKSH